MNQNFRSEWAGNCFLNTKIGSSFKMSEDCHKICKDKKFKGKLQQVTTVIVLIGSSKRVTSQLIKLIRV